MSRSRRFDVIAFDADDTLWHDIHKYHDAEQQFIDILSRYHDPAYIRSRLYETDIRNLRVFGYGAKGYILSMVETAIELTEGRISGTEIHEIIMNGRAIITEPIELLPHVQETLDALNGSHRLMIITKGDLFDQESKIARSGLADRFENVEIVTSKEPSQYRLLLYRYGIEPERFMMVGNSLKSDILPVVEVGGQAVYIPYDVTWEHERVTEVPTQRFALLDSIAKLPEYIASQEK